MKSDAVRNIVKFGKVKKAEAIKYVDENFTAYSDVFVLGKPLSYYSLIHNGIKHFRNIE